ncbi:MAG: hypothetical protein AAGM22_06900 [Acidobacteriota bacterium]
MSDPPAVDRPGPPGAGGDSEDSQRTTADGAIGGSPDPARRVWIVVAVAVLAVVAGATTFLSLWGRNDPSAPLEGLGLGGTTATGAPEASDGVEAPSDAADAEQAAFLERQKARAQELAETTESLEDERGVTLTDRGLIRRLAGRWRLDIGGRQTDAEFAPVVVDRVRRGSLLVELYPVESRHLPPFYTAFELPDRGTFIAFRAADGDYRLVLEDVRFHGSDLFSYRLGSGGRRQAYRRRGDGPFPRDDAASAGRESPQLLERPGGGVDIRVDPVPPASRLWARAESLRKAKLYHSLRRHLDQMLRFHPDHRQARRWRARVDRWIDIQREDLVDDVRDRLDDIHDGVGDHDLEEIFEAWGGRPDSTTRVFFEELLTRHREVEARITLHTVRVEDGVASFDATVTLEGWSGRPRDREIIPHRWRGQLVNGRVATPFR